MCFSLRVSLFSWFISLIACIYLFNRNKKYDRWVAMFVLVFSQIQILESLLWMSYNKSTETFENPYKCQFIVFIIFYALWFQPVINFFGAYLTTKNKICLYVTGFYILLLSYLAVQTIQNTWSVSKGENGHFVWHRYDDKKKEKPFMGNSILGCIYVLGLFLPVIFIQNRNLKLTLLTFGLTTMLYLRYKYPNEWSSMWCAISVVIPVLTIIVNT